MILRLEKASKRFGELFAVRGISFEVKKGEIFGIAGPNGAGKTTLFNLIAGALRGSGKIIFDGEDIHGLRPDQICYKGIARIFQIPVVFPTLTVFQNVEVGAHFGTHGAQSGKESVDEIINFLELQGKENAVAGGIDLYVKKLTMLGAALATKPKLLLLDEPVGGLSPMESRHFVELVGKINQELGVTIIVIEHLMKVLTEISHRLMILSYGEQICIGPPKEVMKDREVIKAYLT